jgi:SNF2 family DNA or RNA helicase
MLRIEYREIDRRAVLSWSASDADEIWLQPVKALIVDNSEESCQETSTALSLPWWTLISLRPQLFELFLGFGLQLGKTLAVDAPAANLLKQSKQNADSYNDAVNAKILSQNELITKLESIGFSRKLTAEQERNVRKLAALRGGATFSVPGAGKTTEAIATFFYRASDTDRLLVIAPKNAFGAWDEQLDECFPKKSLQFVRLRGGKDRIRKLLLDDPRFMLITYQQLTQVREIIAGHISRYSSHVFLDESHRIKSGLGGPTVSAVLSLSHLPVGKLLMSGTPMPQASRDLIPQFAFLYPEIRTSEQDVVSKVQPIYVRTTKDELGLKRPIRYVKKLDMNPVQRGLYELMRSEVARDATLALKQGQKSAFRNLGRSVARLLQFVSNPSLLAAQIGFAHSALLKSVLAEGDGPKLEYVLERARSLAEDGKKVLIWSSFVRNVEYLATRLGDYGAVYIHGQVEAGDEDDDETREGKIKLFHDDQNTMIMVANPAAASEGISLHKVCHHALYLDRTFNAAHYLQSEDRIHRLGLPPDQDTTIEIVECRASIDRTVRDRLKTKIDTMAEALSDNSLNVDVIPLDPVSIDDPEDYAIGLDAKDIEALLNGIETAEDDSD